MRSAIDALPENRRLRNWDIPDYDVSLNEEACAALLAHVVLELGIHKEPATWHDVENLAEPWRAGADQCRVALDLLGPAVNRVLANALSIAQEHFDEMADLIERAKKYPYVLPGKGTRDLLLRTQVRTIAVGTRAIFGSILKGMVAEIASVALQIELTDEYDDLTAQSARKLIGQLPDSSEKPRSDRRYEVQEFLDNLVFEGRPAHLSTKEIAAFDEQADIRRAMRALAIATPTPEFATAWWKSAGGYATENPLTPLAVVHKGRCELKGASAEQRAESAQWLADNPNIYNP